MIGQNAPVLECVYETNNGNNALNWNFTNDCGATFTEITVYASLNFDGPYQSIKSITNPAQIDDVLSTLPGGTNYIYLQTDCSGSLSATTDTLSNLLPPSPDIEKASVNLGEVEISWTELTSTNIAAYLIYRKGSNDLFQLIDTVFADSGTPNVFIDVSATPELDSQEYSVTAMDFCQNSGTPSDQNSHRTVFLQVSHDSCSNVINMEWNNYKGWDAISEFSILRNGDEIATLPADQFTYDYVLQSSDAGSIALVVRAVKDDGITTTFSNQTITDVDVASLPEFIYLNNLSIVNTNQVQLEWLIDQMGSADNLVINRGTSVELLEEVSDLGPISIPPQPSDVDNTVDTKRGAYYYSISAINSCGVAVHSDTARTIFLNGQDNFDLSNGLFWNEFELPRGEIQQYILTRIVPDNDPIPLEYFGPNQELSYNDDVTGIDPENGQYCYRVECVFETASPNGEITTSKSFSNILCISQTSRIFVPNVFAPNGINNEFKPIIVYPNTDEYSLIVMTRWGEKVFETNNPDLGWDGTVRGDLGPQGVYAYVIQMRSTNGNQLERKGTVMLLR